MRPCEGKEFALWLDHSGNFLRFREDWDEVYEDGVQSLEGKGEATKKEPTEKIKSESKCPACNHLWPSNSDSCPACGHIRQKRNHVDAVAGEMIELATGQKSKRDDKQQFYSQLLWIANDRSYNQHWASHKYREKFGVWPRGLETTIAPPTLTVQNWIKHRNIAWSKKREKING